MKVEEKNPRVDNRLVMGPWFHGGWVRGEGRELGDADFGFATAETYRERVELRFFEHHLKDKGEVDLPEWLAAWKCAYLVGRLHPGPGEDLARSLRLLRAGRGVCDVDSVLHAIRFSSLRSILREPGLLRVA